MTHTKQRAYRLLVIDDESIVGKRLHQIFTKMGYDVEAFIDPKLAIAAAEQEPFFDIVVTDLKMQDMDGLEVLRRVKKVNPSTRVIMITGYAEMETADAAFQDGVFDFIPKPFRLDVIKEAILKAVESIAEEGG